MSIERALSVLTESIDGISQYKPEELADFDATLMLASAALFSVYKRAWESKMLRDHPYQRETND